MKTRAHVILLFILPMAAAIATAKWTERAPAAAAPPPIPAAAPAPIPRRPEPAAVAPGHVRIINATGKDFGFLVFPKDSPVICPQLPPQFGAACIDVPAHSSVDTPRN